MRSARAERRWWEEPTENVSTALLVPTNSYPTGMADGRGAWYVVMHNIGSQAGGVLGSAVLRGDQLTRSVVDRLLIRDAHEVLDEVKAAAFVVEANEEDVVVDA